MLASVAALVLLGFAGPTAEELYRRGVELFQQGKLADSALALRQASTLAPGNPQMWKSLGVALAAAEDYEGGASAFQQACRLGPALADACYYYGRSLYALNRFTPAIAPLKQALTADPGDWRALAALAQIHEALGEPADAERTFTRAVALYTAPTAQRSGADDPRTSLGVFLFRQGRLGEAIEPLRHAVRDKPDAAKAQFELGRVLYQTGTLEEAIQHLTRAADLRYGSAAHLLLGKALLRAGRDVEAQPHLKLGSATQ